MERGKQIVNREKIVGNLFSKLRSKTTKSLDISLKTILDVDQQIERFKQNKLDLIEPSIIYKTPKNPFSGPFICQHYSERQLSCTHEDQQIKLDLINHESWKKLEAKDLSLIHMGRIINGIKGLHRPNLGAKLFLCLYDDRFIDIEKGLLGSIELDMNKKGGIVCFAPNYLLPTKKFYHNIRIGIKSKGYDMKEVKKIY